MMNEDYIRNRITELRIKKGVSEYKMSLELGHSRSYMQSISSGRSLPSLLEFLYICEYLNVTPKDFFDQSIRNPELVQKAVEGLKNLDDSDVLMILNHINRLQKK